MKCHFNEEQKEYNKALTLVVGFGQVNVTKDDELIYTCCGNGYTLKTDGIVQEYKAEEWNDYPKIDLIEKIAKDDPEHVWEIHFIEALSEELYRRQNDGRWILVESGPGFA